MFRSKITMQQHANKPPQNNFILHHDREAPPLPYPKQFNSQVKSSFQFGKSYHPSSFSLMPSQPHFITNSRQNTSSSSSSTSSESLHSVPFTYESSVHQPSSMLHPSSSLTDEDQLGEYENRLLKEVEVTDQQGNVLRIQKMTAKEVFKLNENEKILVHVNDLEQPIKAAGGLCTRFMTLLLKQPNLCPPEAKDWPELKLRSGIKLLVEFRRRFILPERATVDKVIFDNFEEKFRSRKSKFKDKLFKLAAKHLNEANGIVGPHEYSEDDLLQALDLLEIPTNFKSDQWELYKSRLRSPTAKKLSRNGKKARAQKLHSHTTGSMSYARKRDEFKLKNKREVNEVEFFGIAYQMKKETDAGDVTKQFMKRAEEEISRRVLEIGSSEPIDPEKRAEIEKDVMMDLMGADRPGRARGHGTGVTKSQVNDFNVQLRRMREKNLTNQNRLLLDKVESQNQVIDTQNKKMKTLEQKIDECTGEIQLCKTVFRNFYGAGTSGDMFFAREDISSTQRPCSAASFDDC